MADSLPVPMPATPGPSQRSLVSTLGSVMADSLSVPTRRREPGRRATGVPRPAGTSGIQRSTTVTSRRPLGWPHSCDLGWGEAETAWHARVKPLEWLSFLVLDAQRRVGRRSEPEGHHRWLHVGLYGERFD